MGIILPQIIIIKWNRRIKKYYEEKGYKFTKMGDAFEIDVKDLHPGSNYKVKCICDYHGENCLNEFEKIRREIIDPKKIACPKCKMLKIKETNLCKYGVEHPAQSKEIQKKIKQTNLERYGVEIPLQNEIIHNKYIQTNLERYGVEYTFENEIIKEKSKQTILKKFNVNFVFQSEEVKKKIKQTMLKKYGVEYSCQSKELRKKIEQTCLKNFGVTTVFKHPEIRKQSQIIANQSKYKNGTSIRSNQQEYICNLLNGELNYPISNCFLDIAFLGEKIYIEYDGSGHDLSTRIKNNKTKLSKEQLIKKFNENEIKRKKFLQTQNWDLIRIISKKDKLPQDDIIINLVNECKNYLNTGHSWIEIDIDNDEMRCSQFTKKLNLTNLRKIKKSDLKEQTKKE